MCLITFHNTPLIADKDIVSYKIVEKIYDINGDARYITPYQKIVITPNTKYSEPELENDFVYNGTEFTGYVSKGFFHSYSSLEETQFICEHFQPINCSATITLKNYVIMKCIIPKNTKYYTGIFHGHVWLNNKNLTNYNSVSYASKSIKILDEYVPDNN